MVSLARSMLRGSQALLIEHFPTHRFVTIGGVPVEILYDHMKTDQSSRSGANVASSPLGQVSRRKPAKSLNWRSRAMATADTPAAATRSTTVRAHGAYAFHAS